MNVSNMVDSMLDNANSSYHLAFSFGYARKDSKTIKSGFGLQYLLGIDQDIIDNSSAKNKNLFGLSIFSFIEIPLDRVSIGVRSFFDFGSSSYNFIFGPTIGYSFDLNNGNISIIYFKGCSDFINFSRFTDSIELRIILPFKGKDN